MERNPAFYHQEVYPDLVGRPKRDEFFNHDDLLNLKIALELCNDVNDLFQDPHLF